MAAKPPKDPAAGGAASLSISASANPAVFGSFVTLAGKLTAKNAGGRTVRLEADPCPYGDGFAVVGEKPAAGNGIYEIAIKAGATRAFLRLDRTSQRRRFGADPTPLGDGVVANRRPDGRRGIGRQPLRPTPAVSASDAPGDPERGRVRDRGYHQRGGRYARCAAGTSVDRAGAL
jgi:hypothetical protein